MKPFNHCTVLLHETVNLLTHNFHLKPEDQPLLFADCTLGGAGHTLLLLQHLADELKQKKIKPRSIEIVCCDQDPQAIQVAKERIELWRTQNKEEASIIEITFLEANFKYLPSWLKTHRPNTPITGLMADLGVSSPQLDEAERGFSFLREGPLDMRMNTNTTSTAKDLLLTLTEKDLEKIFSDYGEEPRARALAKAIVKDRENRTLPLSNTIAFAQYVERVLGYHQSRTHPATRVFQALRIAVNEELTAIEELLKELPQLMASNSTVAFISFHSLEDRLVKQFFKAWEAGNTTPQEKKAHEKQSMLEQHMGLVIGQTNRKNSFGHETPRGGATASREEISNNPRSRSARLRGFMFNSAFQNSSMQKI